MSAFAREGGQLVTLRPGCVYGPGSQLWVERLGRWLRSRRVGDLGLAGDGWSNLVHIDDVCQAAAQALELPVSSGGNLAFNLAAPDSPRWNVYLRDLAIATGAIPVRRVSPRRLWIDSAIFGPPLKALERLLDAAHLPHEWLPEPLPPSVLRLWRQEIRLNVQAATDILRVTWTGYEAGLQQSARWFVSAVRAG
jgi:nucleoside-diphosphate-sugar epimerase